MAAFLSLVMSLSFLDFFEFELKQLVNPVFFLSSLKFSLLLSSFPYSVFFFLLLIPNIKAIYQTPRVPSKKVGASVASRFSPFLLHLQSPSTLLLPFSVLAVWGCFYF